jgi:hypothetical protein
MGDDGRDGDRLARVDRRGDLAELGERLAVDHLDEHVEDAAAREPDGERVLVADAVPLKHRLPV